MAKKKRPPRQPVSKKAVTKNKKAPPKKATKKASTKKTQPKKKKVVKVAIEVPEIVEVKPSRNEALRRLAFTTYTMSFHKVSVEAISRHPEFSGVTLDTLERWCREDRWIEKRDEYQTQAQNQFAKVMLQRNLQYQKEELGRLQEMGGHIWQQLFPQADENGEVILPPPLKSFESAVTAYLKIQQEIDKRMENVQADILPQIFHQEDADESPQQLAKSNVMPQLSSKEARAAAKVILQMRREDVRQQLQAEQNDEADELDDGDE